METNLQNTRANSRFEIFQEMAGLGLEKLNSAIEKILVKSMEALKIQAEMVDEEAPFDAPPISNPQTSNLLTNSLQLRDWIAKNKSLSSEETVVLAVAVQLRDPIRRLEAVGGPVIAVIFASGDGKKGFTATSVHVGGLAANGKRESERQRLTAKQWLVANGVGGKAKGKQGPSMAVAGERVWSVSSRVLAEMWLSYIRNPDVKFAT